MTKFGAEPYPTHRCSLHNQVLVTLPNDPSCQLKASLMHPLFGLGHVAFLTQKAHERSSSKSRFPVSLQLLHTSFSTKVEPLATTVFWRIEAHMLNDENLLSTENVQRQNMEAFSDGDDFAGGFWFI